MNNGRKTTSLPGGARGLGTHGFALALAWLAVTVTLVAMILTGVRQTDRFDDARTALQIAYVAVLLWYLARTGPPAGELAEMQSHPLRRWFVARWASVAVVALLLVASIVSDEGDDVVMQLMIGATLWALVAWFRRLRAGLFAQGFALGVVAYLAAIPLRDHGVISATAHVLLPALVPFMYVAGVLLIRRTGLGRVQLASGRYAGAFRGFLWGCLLFVPLGLFNAADGSPGFGSDWVTRPWLPFWTPLFSGIAEEAWYRLLLVPLIYLLLRPALRVRPELVALAAALFSAITFGAGHGRSFDTIFTTGLLYGLPMALVFARRDWEHAVGGHYTVNMIPMLAVYLRL